MCVMLMIYTIIFTYNCKIQIFCFIEFFVFCLIIFGSS